MTKQSALTAFLLACSACSGGQSSPDAGTALGYTKIDDMEGLGNVIAWPPPSGTAPGFWWTTTDCSEADRISPTPDWVDPNGWSYAALPDPHETFSGVVSTHAARLRTTSPLVGIWGAEMGLTLAGLPGVDGGLITPVGTRDAGADGGPTAGQACSSPAGESFNGVAVDLSGYSGITFWAKGGSASAKAVSVELVDGDVDPRGGVCNDGNPANDGNCYNGFGTTILLSASFTRYSIDFSSLQQSGNWGYHPPSGVIDLQHVYYIDFTVRLPACEDSTSNSMCAGGPPPVTLDLWIDDLYFVNGGG